MLPVIERLLRYVRINTRSVLPTPGVKQTHPSSQNQRLFAGQLKVEFADMGVSLGQIRDLDDGSFLVHFPATKGHEDNPHVVFASHVDTYFGCPGGADPQIHNYEGGDLRLPKNDVVIPASDLVGLEGKHIITADGTTLLGGDDKAGIAAIMTFVESMLANNIAHGPLTIWICTDEEIGEVGVKFLPEGIAEQWDFFWTVDGERLNVIDVGCFYGAKIDIVFCGNDTHPGVSGHSLRPAHYAAGRFLDKLADGPSPWTTKDEQSFIYVPTLPALTAGEARFTIIPRTFNPNEFQEMRATIERVAKEAADRYGVTASVGEVELQYVSTEVAIDAHRDLLQPGIDALLAFGIDPQLHRVRAGTDGAMLNMTHPKIPAPNLGTGARNLHGVREFVVEEELELVPEILLRMVTSYSRMRPLTKGSDL